MAFPTKTLNQLVARGVGVFRAAFPGRSVGTKKFLGRTARAVALVLWGLQKSIEDLDLDIVPQPQSSTDALSAWAFLLGLPDGQGGYGRILARAASGGQATLTGVKGTVFPDGAVATAEDGTTQVALSGSVTVPGSGSGLGSVAADFVAVTKGTVGNLLIGSVLTWVSPPAGADATFTLTTALGGGVDLESNPGVYARIVQRLQIPPRGGVSQDYREWAEVDGVTDVWVYPLRDGTGTVTAAITGGGSGVARVPSGDVQLAAQDQVDLKRPVAVDAAFVVVPTTVTGHEIRVRVVPAQGRYAFDFDDGGGATVDAYTAGPPAKIRYPALAPDSLKNAIDAYNAGLRDEPPRLQVLSTGSGAVNPLVGAVAWADVGGKTEVTLETLPAGWTAPTAGDVIYAGGPVVETIAAGVAALVDALGPSRVSGYGDPLSPWRDKLTISSIIAVAEDAIDTDGSELIDEVPVGFVTIDGVAADVEGADNRTNAPELLFAAHVAVTA